MTKKKLPENVINPFSDAFLDTWDLWKSFKKEEFNFQYKGVISEQVALINLKTISNNNESEAILIINQSIGEKWKGLFPLTDKYKKLENGKIGATNKQIRDVKTQGIELGIAAAIQRGSDGKDRRV